MIASGDITGKIIVDTSTVHPDTTIDASKLLSSAGAIFGAGKYSSYSQVPSAYNR
jgi:3-hydroxyisobutyrate dehydrogenase-like beta-hydroxyacid dehydrogenase